MTRILKGRSEYVKTSETDPIRVDWLAEQPWEGRMGLTHAPGKKNESYHHFTWARDLDMDLSRLGEEYGVQVLVSLVEEDEMAWMGIPHLRQDVTGRGMESLWYPIADLDAPGGEDMLEFVEFCERILERLDRGRVVVGHCRGGVGRAGLLGACLLVLRGLDARRAIGVVREARGPSAVEMPVQEEFVEDLEALTRR